MRRKRLVGLFLLLVAANGALDAAADLSQTIGELAEQRSEAENAVQVAKANLRQGFSRPEDLVAIRKAYNEAKTAFDRYLAQLKVTLTSGTPVESVKPYLERAAQKNQEFLKLAEAYDAVAKLQMRADSARRDQGPAGGGAPATAIGKGLLAAGPLLLDATKAIWEEHKKADAERRAEILKLVEEQRWRDFDSIGTHP